MSYTKLVADFQSAFLTEGSGVASVDSTTHANKFSNAVHSYVMTLLDPAKRPPISGVSSVMVPLIVAVGAVPGTGVASVDAAKSALSYASAVLAYVPTVVPSSSPISLPLGGIVVPPGNVLVANTVPTSLFASLQSDFTSIFSEETQTGLPIQAVALQKATKFGNAIKKAFTTGTLVTLSGLDSTVPVPIPFLITGPLSEV